jgi:hypothetical protein
MRLYVSRPAHPEDEGWADVPFQHPDIVDPFLAAREAILFCHIKRWEQAALGYNELTAPVGVPGNRNAENPHKALVLECLRETVANVKAMGTRVKDADICRSALRKAAARLPEGCSTKDLPGFSSVKRWLRALQNLAQTR